MASGWGKEGVGQQQTPAQETPSAFPFQPRNEGQTTAPLSLCPPCSAAENRAEGEQPWTELGAGAWQPRIRLGKDLSGDKGTLSKHMFRVRGSYIPHLVNAGSALWKMTHVFLAAGPEGCAGSSLCSPSPACRREVLLAGSRITLLSPFHSCCWL